MYNLKKVSPLHDYVYLELDEFQEKVGSIILAPKHSETSRLGTIIAAGPECKYLKDGDRVLVYWNIGTHIDELGDSGPSDRVRFAHEEDILAVVTEG